jgi:hypothetical protein
MWRLFVPRIAGLAQPDKREGTSGRLVRQLRVSICKPGQETMTLDISHLTLFLVATVCALAMAFVWMFCEVERRFGQRIAATALARFGYRADGTLDPKRIHRN